MIKIVPNKVVYNGLVIGENMLVFTSIKTPYYNLKTLEVDYVIVTEQSYIDYKRNLKKMELENEYLNANWDLNSFVLPPLMQYNKRITIDDMETTNEILTDWEKQNQIVVPDIVEMFTLSDTDYELLEDIEIDYSDIEQEIQALVDSLNADNSSEDTATTEDTTA